MERQIETFVSTKPSRFFTKSEYEHIGHDFNLQALGELVNPEFTEEIKSKLRFCYIKKFIIEDRDTCYFF